MSIFSKRLSFLLAIFTAILLWSKPLIASQNTIVVKDDLNNKLSFDSPVSRIASLAPHITELLFHIERGHLIVTTADRSDFPDAAKQIPQIGGYDQINIEKIVSLKPDLIISWQTGNNQRQVDKLKSLGFPIYYSEPKSLADISKTIRNFGILTNNQNFAKNKANAFDQAIINLKPKHKKHTKVFYEVWHKPLFTINGNQIISEVIRYCGGENIFANSLAIAPIVNFEAVIERNPQLIILSEGSKESLKDWQRWPVIDAVKNNNILVVNPDHIVRPTPRILKGMKSICEQISNPKKS